MTRQTNDTRLPATLERFARRLVLPALATVIASASALAAPGGGISEHQTEQNGNWHDSTTWLAGDMPVNGASGTFVYLKHDVFLSTPATATVLYVGFGASSGLLYQQGGDLDCDELVIGRGPGAMDQGDGSTTASEITLGGLEDGSLRLEGGTVSTDAFFMGGAPGATTTGRGFLDVEGSSQSFTVTGEFAMRAGSMVSMFPEANGSDGLTPIHVGSAEFETGAIWRIGFEYPAHVGDGWDVLVSDTPIVGLPDIEMVIPEFGDVVFDTSDPFVLRAVVTDSLWPVWTDLGGASTGINGSPALLGSGGLLAPGAFTGWELSQAPADAPVLLVVSGVSTPLGVFGGTLHAFPWDFELLQFTNSQGGLFFEVEWPSNIPGGLDLWVQYLCDDPSVIFGLTLSNAITATTAAP